MKADCPYSEMIAFAHAVDPALHELAVVANNPIQGEAMHKVIGFYAHNALKRVGWYDSVAGFHAHTEPCDYGNDCHPVYIVTDPGPYKPSQA